MTLESLVEAYEQVETEAFWDVHLSDVKKLGARTWPELETVREKLIESRSIIYAIDFVTDRLRKVA